VLAKAAGEPWAELFDRLVARPLQFGRYHLFLAPTGEAYTGGGARLLARDFLKVAQLMMDGGVWHGERILSKEWAQRSTAALHDLTPRQQYGYLWNSVAYPYRGKTVRAFFAAGNGGQIFMGIPDLDLAIAFTGGNYADAALFIPQRVLVPEQILPAIK
jgi:CubicO group peptidase (beta-lactamase class C family)